MFAHTLREDGPPVVISLILGFLVVLATIYRLQEWQKIKFFQRPEIRELDKSLIEAITNPEKVRRDRNETLARLNKDLRDT